MVNILVVGYSEDRLEFSWKKTMKKNFAMVVEQKKVTETEITLLLSKTQNCIYPLGYCIQLIRIYN